MTKHFAGDTTVLLGRSLRHIGRSPDTIITTAIMPIGFLLLFVYVFGGAIETGTGDYVDYLLPGILLITIASGISYAAYRLFLDLQSGIFERFQSMPIARSSVLWAHVLTSLVANLISVAVVVLVALLMGFRSGAFVPTESVPAPVRAFAENQPVTSIVDSMRSLFSGQPVGADLWVALAWCGALLVVAYAVAMAVYHRKIA